MTRKKTKLDFKHYHNDCSHQVSISNHSSTPNLCVWDPWCAGWKLRRAPEVFSLHVGLTHLNFGHYTAAREPKITSPGLVILTPQGTTVGHWLKMLQSFFLLRKISTLTSEILSIFLKMAECLDLPSVTGCFLPRWLQHLWFWKKKIQVKALSTVQNWNLGRIGSSCFWWLLGTF